MTPLVSVEEQEEVKEQEEVEEDQLMMRQAT